MEPVTKDEFREFLLLAGINQPASNLGIGKEIAYIAPATREIVVHLETSGPEEYVQGVVVRILDLEEGWVLFPRHGSVNDLGLIRSDNPVEAIRYNNHERNALAGYLCTRSMHHGSVSTDLYIISSSGSVLITWDHHTKDEGLSIQFRRSGDASRLLQTLNELGAELELYYVES